MATAPDDNRPMPSDANPVPSHSVLERRLNDALPQTQCTRCGYPDCRAYATAMATEGAPINQCPPGGAEGISRLAALTGRPVIPLNPANIHNPDFGRVEGDTASGHWLYAFLRNDPRSGETFLVTANLHRTVSLENIRIQLPPEAIELLDALTPLEGLDELNHPPLERFRCNEPAAGLEIRSLPPLSAAYWILRRVVH